MNIYGNINIDFLIKRREFKMCFVDLKETRRSKFNQVETLYQLEQELVNTYHSEDIIDDDFLFKITYDNFCTINDRAKSILRKLTPEDEYDNIIRYGLGYIIRSSTVMISLMKKRRPELVRMKISERIESNEHRVSTAF